MHRALSHKQTVRQRFLPFGKGFDRANRESPFAKAFAGGRWTLAYTVAQVAAIIDVSQNTIRNWERELTPFVQAARDESGTRRYDEQAITQFRRVSRLRDMGLSVATIRDILAVMTDDSASSTDFAAATWQTSAGAQEVAAAEAAHEPMESALLQLKEGLQSFIEQNLHSIDIVQREILANLQQVTGKTPKRRWLNR